jgi:dienelactone hydrolase
MRTRLIAAVSCSIALAGCFDTRLASKPGAYEVSSDSLLAKRRPIPVVLVRPVHDQHPGYLVVFATGDDGWSGTSAALFQHLADQGYTLAGFSAPGVLAPVVGSGELVSTRQAARGLKEIYALARRHLGLADSTPIVIVGFSRGATVVAFTAVHPELKGDIAGAVAIALTREADYLHVPEHERGPAVQVDKQGRLQLYPAVKLLGSTRIAVIQSTNDRYVPAAESRQLLGPDTATLRLYPVESKNHGFSDARDKLMEDLDGALHWVEQPSPASAGNAIAAPPVAPTLPKDPPG